jgi:hypothetical protein
LKPQPNRRIPVADIPLSVLDLVPVSSGSDVAEAVRNTVDLARRTEEFGYHRYWFAEHHLNPGVADRMPERVGNLVYVDAVVPGHGDSCWALASDQERRWYLDVEDGGYATRPLHSTAGTTSCGTRPANC